MEVTRILPLRQFDTNKSRFSNVVFKHASGLAAGTPDGKLGISVFEMVCACAQHAGECTCSHIAQWYAGVFPMPCAFWTFDTAILQPPTPNADQIPEPVLVQQDSHSGDTCHYNIHHLGDSRAKRIFDAQAPQGGLGLCVEGVAVPFDPALAADLKRQHFADPA
jgi:hypothetical protein